MRALYVATLAASFATSCNSGSEPKGSNPAPAPSPDAPAVPAAGDKDETNGTPGGAASNGGDAAEKDDADESAGKTSGEAPGCGDFAQTLKGKAEETLEVPVLGVNQKITIGADFEAKVVRSGTSLTIEAQYQNLKVSPALAKSTVTKKLDAVLGKRTYTLLSDAERKTLAETGGAWKGLGCSVLIAKKHQLADKIVTFEPAAPVAIAPVAPATAAAHAGSGLRFDGIELTTPKATNEATAQVSGSGGAFKVLLEPKGGLPTFTFKPDKAGSWSQVTVEVQVQEGKVMSITLTR